MASSVIDLYGFLSDTAFMNRDFDQDVIGSASNVDQGACCFTDSVQNMFGTVGYVKDGRLNRVALPTISVLDPGWTDDATGIRDAIRDQNEHLNGKMCLIVNNPQDIAETVKAAFDTPSVDRLFEFLEIAFNFQVFNDSETRTLDNDTLNAILSNYSDIITVYDFSEEVVDVNNCYYLNLKSKRKVRSWVSCTWRPTTDLAVNLKVWAGRAAFLKDFPVSTITDVIFPCQYNKLYNLTSEYASMTDYASRVSDGEGSIYSLTNRTYAKSDINDLLASDDHTGVYKFKTNYYSNPDDPNAKVFELTFGVVYKGAKPTLDLVRDAIRTAIFQVDQVHDEQQWVKKLPGIVSGRTFYMLPLFDADGNINRSGIINVPAIAGIIMQQLGDTVAAVAASAQVISYANLNYAVIVVPSPANPLATRLISKVYPDFMGVPNTDERFNQQSESTRNFSVELSNAISKAYQNDSSAAGVSSDDVPAGKRFIAFTSSDGINFCVMTRSSFTEQD